MKRNLAWLIAGSFLLLSLILLLKPPQLSHAAFTGQQADAPGINLIFVNDSIASQNQFQVAVIGFARAAGKFDDPGARSPEKSLADSLARDGRIALIDRALFEPALAGLGYSGSLNMTTTEARDVGALAGCDFFITGKAEALTRSERENGSHEEAIIGVMIVDGRSGALAAFDFINEKAETKQKAVSRALDTLSERAAGYINQMTEFRAARNSKVTSSNGERIEDIPDEGSPAAEGFTPPEFLNRVKPEYTEQADRADISTTVEAMAVFHADGRVGDIEIIRWAGFGLDAAAARAIRSLKFKPATRDGRPVSVRALVRYNFRRISESNSKQAAREPTNHRLHRFHG
ncbi:MAG: energy transducer TonB [Blastocatellia bacterium]|nr:energy transducer TonB [Blastocatellia bacterium]